MQENETTTTWPEEVFFESIITKELSMELYKTTEGNFIAKRWGEEILYDKDWNLFTWNVESFGQPATKIRRGSAIFKKLSSNVEKKEKKEENYVKLTELMGFDVLLDKKTISMVIDVNGEMVGIDKDGMEKIESQMQSFEKVKTTLIASKSGYRTWDRVLLYWPTGTGKTYDFLSSVTWLMADGKIDAFDITTITEWFEDSDFLAHIVPTAKGITYVENKIVTLLREAANGKKVAILLDELNRWSKSFLNLILKLLDAVDGKTYTLNNFVKNETIVIPIENVLFFATMNLWGKYVGTNALDEALFDRFNFVQYKGYNKDVEDEILDNFGTFKAGAKSVIQYVRDLHKEGEIRAPISTRGVKMWSESFINSTKSKSDVLSTFELVLINRLISVDDFGNPNQEEIAIIMKKFKDLGLMGA